jgi:AcrR family transcriptional regulator
VASARQPGATRGRPRDPRVDQAIVETAQRLLATGEYLWMSVDDIADAAGVTKPTLYRRFASKEELAMAAINAWRARVAARTGSGDLRADLVAELHDLRTVSTRYGGMLMTGAVLLEEHHRPELLRRFREGVVRARRERVRGILAEAVARGEIRADADLDAVVTLLIGCWYATYIGEPPIPDDWADRAVDVLLTYLGAHVR